MTILLYELKKITAVMKKITPYYLIKSDFKRLSFYAKRCQNIGKKQK